MLETHDLEGLLKLLDIGKKKELVKYCKSPIKPEIQEYPLSEANRALRELKERKIRGAKVLRIQ